MGQRARIVQCRLARWQLVSAVAATVLIGRRVVLLWAVAVVLARLRAGVHLPQQRARARPLCSRLAALLGAEPAQQWLKC